MAASRTIDLSFKQMSQACKVAAIDLAGIDERTIETASFTLMQSADGEFFGRVVINLRPSEPTAPLDVAPLEHL